MNVRLFEIADNAVLARLFTETIRTIDATDYSPEQVEVWAGVPPDLKSWRDRVHGRMVFVAHEGCEIIGFITFEPDGHVDYLYVHHRFQRQGIGSALLRRIEEEAASQSIRRIFTEASVTARLFFEDAGFQLIAPQTVTVSGVLFLNYRMEKFLTYPK